MAMLKSWEGVSVGIEYIFFTIGGRWPSTDLPDGYWTGTEVSGTPGTVWVVDGEGGHVSIGDGFQSDTNCVVCVASAASKMPTGFIVLSKSRMPWNEAKAYCQQRGGKLPLIGDSNNRSEIFPGTPIDGFGTVDGPWPKGLPSDSYWTGTAHSDDPSSAWVVNDSRGDFSSVYFHMRRSDNGVVCVR